MTAPAAAIAKKAPPQKVAPRRSSALTQRTDSVAPILRRSFQTESEYHPVADQALDSIQDCIDDALETTSIEYEITLASGVLTLVLPPHGTWVINKQTPNQQIWWSSPLSGPKRFEYDEKDKVWFSTKDGLSLGPLLVQEIRHVRPDVEEFEIDV